MNPPREFELVIKKKRSEKKETDKDDTCSEHSSAPSLGDKSEIRTKELPPQKLVVPIPMDMIKNNSGCSTTFQCEIEQIIRGLLSIEIQLDNEEYECEIREKSCKTSCSPKPPVLTIPPPPPPLKDEAIIAPTLPPKPYNDRRESVIYSSTAIPSRNYNEKWRQSVPILEMLHEYEPEQRVKFTPSPSPRRRITKPMLRPKLELMEEFRAHEFCGGFRCSDIYQDVLPDEIDYYQTMETKRIPREEISTYASASENIDGKNPFSMPTMELEGFSCKTQSTESIYCKEEVQQSRAIDTKIVDKKKKKFSCV